MRTAAGDTGRYVSSERESLDSPGESEDDEDEDAANHIVAVTERVKHERKAYKVKLRHGIMHVNGKDYLFNNASCEIPW